MEVNTSNISPRGTTLKVVGKVSSFCGKGRKNTSTQHNSPIKSNTTDMMRHSLALRTSRHLHGRRLHRCCRHQPSQQQHCAPIISLIASRSNNNSRGCCDIKRNIHIQPLPMPALAHCDLDVHDDIDDAYEYGNNDQESSSSLHAVDNIVASAAGGSGSNSSGGGRMMNVSNNNNNDNTTSRFMGGSGGGGGGGNRGGSHHRCPKCGATVTFQDVTKGQQQQPHHQKNCFYCAACSGWFLIKPPSSTTELEDSKFLLSKMAEVAGDDGEKVVGGVSASGQPPNNRKISQPQFVMQHVSSSFFFFFLTIKENMFISFCPLNTLSSFHLLRI